MECCNDSSAVDIESTSLTDGPDETDLPFRCLCTLEEFKDCKLESSQSLLSCCGDFSGFGVASMTCVSGVWSPDRVNDLFSLEK